MLLSILRPPPLRIVNDFFSLVTLDFKSDGSVAVPAVISILAFAYVSLVLCKLMR